MTKRNLFIYDFDGTLTNIDTFVGIIRYYKGFWGMLKVMLLHSPYIFLMKLKLYSNEKTKEKIFAQIFSGMSIYDFNKICEEYADLYYQKIIRDKAIQHINSTHDTKNDLSIIISASIENWVKPFAKKLNIDTVLATKIEVDSNGNLTGRFSSKNCIGKEKVNRLKLTFNNLKEYNIIAFGDSSGDKELLEFANTAYYKPFHK